MSARDVVLLLIRRWRLIVPIYAAVLVFALFSMFMTPPAYRASAKILLTTDRADVSTSADRPTELVRTSQVSDTEMSSQLEILKSQSLIEDVLRQMAPPPGAADDASFSITDLPKRLLRGLYRRIHHLDAGSEERDPIYWFAREILDRVDVDRVKGSNIVEIGLTDGNPVWARDFVSALTAAYVERHAKMQQVSEAETFFAEQSDLLKRKLTDSEAELRKVRERVGTLAGQQAEIHARLNEFDAELARVKIARAEQEERVTYLEGASGKGGRRASPQLLELEAKRAQLLGAYRPDSERIKDIDSEIKRLRDALSSYSAVAGPEGTAVDTGTDIVAARATLAALKGKETAVSQQREEYRRQAQLLDSQDFDITRLERQVKLDEEAYLSYVKAAEQSRLTNALEQSKLLRLTVLEPATIPGQPIDPKRQKTFAYALVGGFILSVGAALARDQFDRTVNSAADIKRYGDLEVLTVLPERS